MASGLIRHRALLVDKGRMGQTIWTKLWPVAQLFLYVIRCGSVQLSSVQPVSEGSRVFAGISW